VRVLIVVLLTTLVATCGQKGPLTLPEASVCHISNASHVRT